MIILASGSPRRKALLSLITENFTIIPADIDETINEEIELFKQPQYLAEKKARFVFENGHQNDIVIGSDTAVFVDGKMIGKPSSAENAKRMLEELSGKKHSVVTGCSIISKNKCVSFSVKTTVEFYKLNDDEIDEYIATNEPMDKAGAYGIQGKGATLVKRIEGDYYNVVGLPVGTLKRKLKEFYTNF